MANIACGGHAGDDESMQRCLELVKAAGIDCGPHPSYPDRDNFGRRSLDIDNSELLSSLHTQVSHFLELADSVQVAPSYIKPHGALYNDCLTQPHVRDACLQLCAAFDLPLMILAGPAAASIHEHAKRAGVGLILEAFADRRYLANGRLAPRSEPNAVIESLDELVAQAQSLKQGFITSISATRINLCADTLCVHGDSSNALAAVKALRDALH
jgi:UPF0271 protein